MHGEGKVEIREKDTEVFYAVGMWENGVLVKGTVRGRYGEYSDLDLEVEDEIGIH